MIGAAHQPHFLPWPGYLNKLARSDCFIWLDTVQYRKNYFQNRTRIVGADRVERWLSLPVHAGSATAIEDVPIADARWRVRVERTLSQSYAKAPWFEECWPGLATALRDAPDDLAGANLRLLRALLDELRLTDPRIIPASQLKVESDDATDRLVQLCRRIGADCYIAGRGGRAYMRTEAFEAEGIRVVWQEIPPEALRYVRTDGADVSGVSVVDALFHLGPAATREMVLNAWRPPQ